MKAPLLRRPLARCSKAPGTQITNERDMTDSLVTSIVMKSNVTLVDICSTRMLGQYGFLAKVGSKQAVGAGSASEHPRQRRPACAATAHEAGPPPVTACGPLLGPPPPSLAGV